MTEAIGLDMNRFALPGVSTRQDFEAKKRPLDPSYMGAVERVETKGDRVGRIAVVRLKPGFAGEGRARSQGDPTSTQAEGLDSSSGVAAGEASPVGKPEEFHGEIFDPMIPCARERYPIGATFSSAISRVSSGIRS